MLREDRLTLVGIVLALVAYTAGCAGGSDKAARDETSTAAETMSTPAGSRKPLRCLDAAGLANVEERGAGLWSGVHDSPTLTYRIVVHKLMHPVKAPRVVAGEYAVTGSFKVVAVGRGFIGVEGIQADALVQIVADCLGG
jgi:hypothetical protein